MTEGEASPSSTLILSSFSSSSYCLEDPLDSDKKETCSCFGGIMLLLLMLYSMKA